MSKKEFRVKVIQFLNCLDKKITNLHKNQEEIKSEIATIKNTMEP